MESFPVFLSFLFIANIKAPPPATGFSHHPVPENGDSPQSQLSLSWSVSAHDKARGATGRLSTICTEFTAHGRHLMCLLNSCFFFFFSCQVDNSGTFLPTDSNFSFLICKIRSTAAHKCHKHLCMWWNYKIALEISANAWVISCSTFMDQMDRICISPGWKMM